MNEWIKKNNKDENISLIENNEFGKLTFKVIQEINAKTNIKLPLVMPFPLISVLRVNVLKMVAMTGV